MSKFYDCTNNTMDAPMCVSEFDTKIVERTGKGKTSGPRVKVLIRSMHPHSNPVLFSVFLALSLLLPQSSPSRVPIYYCTVLFSPPIYTLKSSYLLCPTGICSLPALFRDPPNEIILPMILWCIDATTVPIHDVHVSPRKNGFPHPHYGVNFVLFAYSYQLLILLSVDSFGIISIGRPFH